MSKMQHLEVSGAVRHIYIYVIRRLKVNYTVAATVRFSAASGIIKRVQQLTHLL